MCNHIYKHWSPCNHTSFESSIEYCEKAGTSTKTSKRIMCKKGEKILDRVDELCGMYSCVLSEVGRYYCCKCKTGLQSHWKCKECGHDPCSTCVSTTKYPGLHGIKVEVKGEDHEVVVKEEERKIKSEERAAGLVMTKESEIVDITRTIGCDGWKIREAHVGDHFERKRIIDEWIPTTGDNE